jgi:hypothetical protein
MLTDHKPVNKIYLRIIRHVTGHSHKELRNSYMAFPRQDVLGEVTELQIKAIQFFE